MQDRLHHCRARELPQTLQPILPQSPNYQGATWDCGQLWQRGGQNLNKGRGLQNCGGNPKNTYSGHTAPFKKRRGRLSRTPNAHAGTSAGHRWHQHKGAALLLTSHELPAFSLLTGLKGLACPLRLSELPRGESSTQGRSEASCCGGRGDPHTGRSAPAGTFTTSGRHV